MIMHRTRPGFWFGKDGGLGRTKKQLRNAPPAWTKANRLRALELWFHIRFGPNAWSELRKTVAAAERFDQQPEAIEGDRAA